jgi:outer membrane lipoprotein carrier protein
MLAAGPQEPKVPDLAGVQQRYESVRDVRASFVQTSFVASLGREQVSRGRVLVVRPGRMRWEYTEPEASVIVVDADAIRMYTPGDKRLQIAPLGSGAVSSTALGFLLGTGKLVETFNAEPLDPGAAPDSKPGQLGWKLVPREATSFESLELWVEAGSRTLRASVLIDLFGNRTRVHFGEVVENAGVEEAAFTISVPDDTDVLDLR